MNAKEGEKQLHEESFGHVYVWEDGSSAFYPDHKHAGTTAHIILEGEMTITTGGETRTYRAGERFDVPANTLHSARMGLGGCRYLVGE